MQLRLVEGGEGRDGGAPPEWSLDARTRRLGRLGVERARAALRRATPPQPVVPDTLAG